MKLDSAGQSFIRGEEGDKLAPYLDSRGVPTIGYGNTYYEDGTHVEMTDLPITQEQADELWLSIIKQFETGVTGLVRSNINQHQFNALVSFSENEGLGKLKTSTLLQKVNVNPADPSIRNEFMKWVYSGGAKVDGLVNRRQAEVKLYFS
jgi:lysozyme